MALANATQMTFAEQYTNRPCRTCGGTARYPSGGCVSCTRKRNADERNQRMHYVSVPHAPHHNGPRNAPLRERREVILPVVGDTDFIKGPTRQQLMAGR